MSKKQIIIGVVAVVVLALVGGWVVWYVTRPSLQPGGQENNNEPVVGGNSLEEDLEGDELQGGVVSDGEEIDISDWQTYRNEEYGFEVRYPNKWTVSEENNSIRFTSMISSEEEIKRELGAPLAIKISNTESNSSEQWFADQFPDRSQEMTPMFSRFQTATVNGIKYADPLSMGGCDESYVFIYNQWLYQLQRHGSTCDYSDGVFMEIIESLKFNNEEVVASININEWKTYQNKDYDFEIQYPKDWEIEEYENVINFRTEERQKELDKGTNVTISDLSIIVMLSMSEMPSSQVYGDINQMSLEQWVDKEVEGQYLSDKEIINISGVKAYKISTGIYTMGFFTDTIYLERNNKIYALNILSPELKEVNQIIDSFKFIQ